MWHEQAIRRAIWERTRFCTHVFYKKKGGHSTNMAMHTPYTNTIHSTVANYSENKKGEKFYGYNRPPRITP